MVYIKNNVNVTVQQKKRERTPKPSPVTMLLEPFTISRAALVLYKPTPVAMTVSSFRSPSLFNRLDDFLRLRMVVRLGPRGKYKTWFPA
jgi:hypothetical protein